MSVWSEIERTLLGHDRNGDVDSAAYNRSTAFGELTQLIQEQQPFLYELVIRKYLCLVMVEKSNDSWN